MCIRDRGPKRYLLWNDAIYGSTNYRLNFNYNVSEDCFMVANSLIWTVEFISLK